MGNGLAVNFFGHISNNYPQIEMIVSISPSQVDLHFFLCSFSRVMNSRLIRLRFTVSTHLWVSLYHVHLSESMLPHSECFFLVPSMPVKFKMSLFFYHWVVLHFVNVPHFLYLFFYWWHLGCFQVLIFRNNDAMYIVKQMTV